MPSTSIWDFIQKQLLGMQWLSDLITKILTPFGLNTADRWVGSLLFFLYVILGLIIAILGWAMIEKLHMEAEIESFVLQAGNVDMGAPNLSNKDRLLYAKEQMHSTLKNVFPYILLGVGIGASIHNWIPENWAVSFMGLNNPFSVILATLLGLPFVMSVTTLSIPSLVMLRKAYKPGLLAFFVAICVVGIILIGYSLNVIQSSI